VSPLELFALICVFAVVRIAISIRPGVLATATVPEGTQSARTVIREYLDAFIVAGLVALFLITFVVRTFYIPSGSMEPTLQIHDVLLVNEFEYRFVRPRDGDIVVFKPPVESSNDFIKRLVASPGETLRIHNGIVYRDGQALREPYEAQKPNYELEVKNYGIYVDGSRLDTELANIPPKSAWQAPDRIPAGYYFMMGDNRNNSEDSHIWGFAQESGSKSNFVGHAFLLFWPLNRIRILR
jgi:signal peptidase I